MSDSRLIRAATGAVAASPSKRHPRVESVSARSWFSREETAVHLARLGVPAETITVTGIPIDPVFAEPKDPQAMRLRQGLAPDRTTLLVSAGGFGVGPIEHLVRSLLPLQHPAQVVVLCGRSDELRQRIAALAAEVPPTSPITLVPPA